MAYVTEFVDSYIATHPLPQDVELEWAGLTYINVIWQDAMVKGMVGSLISAFIAVFVVMIILFRSLSFGMIAMIPLTVTITSIYGVIGFIGKNYDMPVAILSSLTLGLSVDFAIHFLERSRAIFKQTGSVKETLLHMYEDPARAISRNAIVIAIGFTPLLFAPLTPYKTVGAFLATIMAVSCLVTLMVLPAVLSLASNFLFKPTQNNPGEEK
jgi:predicted RND superfamily exporter protein